MKLKSTQHQIIKLKKKPKYKKKKKGYFASQAKVFYYCYYYYYYYYKGKNMHLIGGILSIALRSISTNHGPWFWQCFGLAIFHLSISQLDAGLLPVAALLLIQVSRRFIYFRNSPLTSSIAWLQYNARGIKKSLILF